MGWFIRKEGLEETLFPRIPHSYDDLVILFQKQGFFKIYKIEHSIFERAQMHQIDYS